MSVVTGTARARGLEVLAAVGGGSAGLPFGPGDTTAGSETELQTAVLGRRHEVDLACAIEGSAYLEEMRQRARVGESSPRRLARLEEHLAANPGVWEHSWVRFPERCLGPFARWTLNEDLRQDRRDPQSPPRGDAESFFVLRGGERHLRVPVSYLLKLALAEAIDGQPARLRAVGERLLGCFSNDNTSPETQSFHVVKLASGAPLARETAHRFLVTQLAAAFADRAFELAAHGQEVMIYLSPHPPVWQRQLNHLLSDSFYRELYLSPCLSGWDRGEEKRDYMALCHQVLSRSRVAALSGLRNAGLLASDLVVLPHTSNVSLANNGTHVSLGSRRLGALLGDPASGFTAAHEKELGDQVSKIFEHFLPLFVGTYSAAPYRFDFAEFHPEDVLGFLPHQLTGSHLRMLWRRWCKKADNRAFGRSWTPTGHALVDSLAARGLRLRGDFVPDFRLLDYPVSWLSTERAPALDGQLGNTERLARELHELGVMDQRMAMYLPYRQRQYARSGFAGNEGRFYSLFPGFGEDFARAVELQWLISAAAWRWVVRGEVSTGDIPDTRAVESERRQLLFAAAIGLPAVSVHAETSNLFLRRLLALTERVRPSRRYAGFLRVRMAELRRGLAAFLAEYARDTAEELGLTATLDDLTRRLVDERATAASRLTAGALQSAGARHPLELPAACFNRAAEVFYRGALRQRHEAEALDGLEATLSTIAASPSRAELGPLLGGAEVHGAFAQLRRSYERGRATREELRRLLCLALLAEEQHAVEDAT